MTQAKKKNSPPGARWDIWLEHGMCHCDTCGMKIPIEEIRIQQGGKSYHRKQKDLFKRRSGGGAEHGDRAAACNAWFSAFPQRGRNALAYTGGGIGEHPRQYVVQPLQGRGRGRHLICTPFFSYGFQGGGAVPAGTVRCSCGRACAM